MLLQQIKSTGSNREIAIKKLKTNTRLKNKACNSPQMETLNKSHEIKLIRRETQHKVAEHKHLKFLTLLTPSVDKTPNLYGSNLLF